MVTRATQKMTGQVVATIPAGAGGVSNAIDIGGQAISAFQTPAAWVAAGLFFETSVDGGVTWRPVVDDAGTELTIASAVIAAANRTVVDNGIINKLRGLTKIRFASGPAALRVDQTAPRVFVVLLKAG